MYSHPEVTSPIHSNVTHIHITLIFTTDKYTIAFAYVLYNYITKMLNIVTYLNGYNETCRYQIITSWQIWNMYDTSEQLTAKINFLWASVEGYYGLLRNSNKVSSETQFRFIIQLQQIHFNTIVKIIIIIIFKQLANVQKVARARCTDRVNYIHHRNRNSTIYAFNKRSRIRKLDMKIIIVYPVLLSGSMIKIDGQILHG